MKKLITLISGIILVLAVSLPGQAATREIPVAGVTGSTNTAATAPVQYLIDGDPTTVWQSDGATTGPLWAQLQLSQAELIDGLEVYGPYTGNLTIEYWQNGGWHSFLAAENLACAGPGWNLIDLSYDRIVTDQIRLTLTATQSQVLGGIGEVQVLGRTSQDVLERLDPVTVSSNCDAEDGHPAAYLFDHDTYSSWQLYNGTSDGEAVADLGESCTIQRIKIFGSNGTSQGNHTDTQFKLQYLSNGNWLDIPGLTNLSAQQLGAAWTSFNLPGGIVAEEVKVVVTSTQGADGIQEIEFWGQKSLPGGSSYLDLSQTPFTLSSGTPANYSFNIANPGPVILHLVTAGTSTTPLAWELNGCAMGNLTPVATIRGYTVYQQTVAGNLLWPGINFIQISNDSLTLEDCKLEVSQPSTVTVPVTGLTDRWLLTPIAGVSQIVDLNGTYHIDELVLTYLGNQPQVQVSAAANGQWVPLSGPSLNNPGQVGGELVYSGIGAIQQVEVSYSAGAGIPTEITIQGSLVNDGPPQVTILSPANGSVIDLSTWNQVNITGTVDNPDATALVNGQGMTLDGTGFQVPLPEAGNPDPTKVIQVAATDAQGRTGSDQVTVTISGSWDLSVNLPETFTYTNQAQITVSGQVVAPQSQVTVNGNAVALSNLSFTQVVPLTVGLNPIIFKVLPPGGSQWDIIQRWVVRTGAPPYLKVLAPVDGQVVNNAQIMVSGQAGGLTPVTVTVNGQAATVTSGSFYLSPVALVPGPNTLTVVATDQNGMSSQVALTVYGNWTPPALTGIVPANGAYLNQPTVTVSGTVTDASPVSVLVNGQAAAITGSQFSIAIPLNEGANALNILATDSAGNTTTVTENVVIDSNPPAAFTPVANPAGWTNNNLPTITFGTTDAESGIDHYTLALDGTSLGTVASPYTFTTAIPDGQHTVTVTAFDKAGNSTAGSVPVYIATVPPAVPAGFQVVSGIAQAIINWQDPMGLIAGYQITRTPAFTGGSPVILTRASNTSVLDQYLDQNVTPGTSYTYTLQAFDYANNYSQATAAQTVTVGIAAQNLNPIGTTTVQFDCVSVTIPPDALSTSGQVVVQASGMLPADSFATAVSPAYNFSLLDQSGQVVPAQFANPVTLQISYAGMVLPSGYNPWNLGIYWYNQRGGYWEKLENVANDLQNEMLTVNLAHFSDYQVMASQYSAPDLSSYSQLGVSPYQSYFQSNQEFVSPAYGDLTVVATDLTLPEPDGIPFTIKRIWNSTVAAQIEEAVFNYPQFGGYGCLYCSWLLNIPQIYKRINGQYIQLPEGQTVKIDWPSDPSEPFVYHCGVQFTLYQATLSNPVTLWTKTITSGYVLILKDGTSYQFDIYGKPGDQLDPSGKCDTHYDYSSEDYYTLVKITDPCQRIINFDYTNGLQITFPGENNERTITYNYTNAGSDNNNNYFYLTSVTDPLGRTTSYKYQKYVYKYGEGCWPNGPDSRDVFPLTTIVYPTQGTSEYTYNILDQTISYGWWTYYVWCQNAQVATHTIGGKVTTYSYTMNSQLGNYGSGTNLVAPNSLIWSSTVTEGGKVVTTSYNQIVLQNGSYSLADQNSLANGISDANDCLKGNLMVSREITNNNLEYDTAQYGYDQTKYGISSCSPTEEDHSRNGSQVYSISNTYDIWGNIKTCTDSSRNLSEAWNYQPHPWIQNLLLNYTATDTSTSTVLLTKSNIYGDSNNSDKPTQTTVSGNNLETRTTNFSYNAANGTLKTQTAPNGLETDFIYDNCNFLKIKTYEGIFDSKTKTYQRIVDADGNMVLGSSGNADGIITINYVYDDQTGLKKSEDDGLGHVTSYDYDDLDRLKLMTLPDTNTRQYAFNDTNNTCTFTNENGKVTTYYYDNLGRLTDIVKTVNNPSTYQTTDPLTGSALSGIKTHYDYNILGQIDAVTDTRSNVTAYQYDSLNRVTQITYPGGATASLSYDDVHNKITYTDEDQGVVTETRDWANRLTGAEQQCYYNVTGLTSTYDWSFNYDPFDNQVGRTDPDGYTSSQQFDGLNNLIQKKGPDITVVDSTTPVEPEVQYGYYPMENKTSVTSPNGNETDSTYDLLGRLITVTTNTTNIITGQVTAATTKYYYDAAGNKKAMLDANKNTWSYTYSIRGFLLTKTDPQGNTTQYQYDALGNKTAQSDPRNTGYPSDCRYTTWYLYDDLSRLQWTVSPGAALTPPTAAALAAGTYDNLYTESTYDQAGNKLTDRDVHGLVTSYTYSPRNWVETVKLNGKLKSQYLYDAKGNRIETENVSTTDNNLDQITDYNYDSLGRLCRICHPLGNTEQYDYDPVGNKIMAEDGLGNQTNYSYNGMGWLTAVKDPLRQTTQYGYDANGNRKQRISANGLTTSFNYDELNRLQEQQDTLGNTTEYAYDPNGNLWQMVDPRGTTRSYKYYPNNALQELDVASADQQTTYQANYYYDAAGNQMTVTDSNNGITNNTINYNFINNIYTPDPLNRINSVDRSFDNATYRTGYHFNDQGLLDQLTYPGATAPLNYNYNDLDQVAEVSGFTAPQGIAYDPDGRLHGITYANNAATTYTYDANRRLQNLITGSGTTGILNLTYTYDNANNIQQINDNLNNNLKSFSYDADNQLTKGITPGNFMESNPTTASPGMNYADYSGNSGLLFGTDPQAVVSLDYDNTSIGLDFGAEAPGIKVIQLVPGAGQANHRITQGTFDIYTSNDNSSYTLISRNDWQYQRDNNGVITITFNQAQTMRYLKLHVWFDSRTELFSPDSTQATFLNQLANMLHVYQQASSQTEEYQYDAAGNRTLTTVTLVNAVANASLYYANSDRLKTNGKFAYQYDNAGNLIAKGNTYTINGDVVTFTTSGAGVEYWQYTYDLLNRLTEVDQNGATVAQYGYDPDGLRVIKRVFTSGSQTDTIHYIFEGNEPIFEKRISDGRIWSYVYASGQRLARVDGVIGNTTTNVFYYHTDHLGSVRTVTNQAGTIVWNVDYTPFGTQVGPGVQDASFTADDLGFTGKKCDQDTGLYYYNARWYDADNGRFISQDPAGDPNNPNLYTYCANNPLIYADSDGQCVMLVTMAIGAGAGGLIQGGGNLISQLASNNWDWGKVKWGVVGVNTITGAASGALAGSGVGIIYMIAGNAFLSGINYSATQIIEKKDITAEGLSASVFLGSIAGLVGGKGIYNEDMMNTEATLLNAEYLGLKSGQTLNRNMLLESVTKAETVSAFKVLAITYVSDFLDKDHPILSKGSTSEGVKELQGFLGIEQTGDYDDQTVAAVKNLQEKLGVTADGLFGPETANALNKAIAQIKASTQADNSDVSQNTSMTNITTTTTNTDSTDSTDSSSSNNQNTGTNTFQPIITNDSVGGGLNIGTIICTELYRQGLMASTIYHADAAFGSLLKGKCPLVLVGYHFWARPIVIQMQKSKTFARFIYSIAKPWTYEMAYLMGARKKGDLAGIVLMSVGMVVCFLIGAIITNVFWIDYLLLILIGILILTKWPKMNKSKSSSKHLVKRVR